MSEYHKRLPLILFTAVIKYPVEKKPICFCGGEANAMLTSWPAKTRHSISGQRQQNIQSPIEFVHLCHRGVASFVMRNVGLNLQVLFSNSSQQRRQHNFL